MVHARLRIAPLVATVAKVANVATVVCLFSATGCLCSNVLMALSLAPSKGRW